ncbi:MAG: methyltransferase domain-containing protein [Bacteroidetes bacterium]|nr:methyltransferase domain-containing protein [Bacteroidota bacterium]
MESQTIKLSPSILRMLHCPICNANLKLLDNNLVCLNYNCGVFFPIINGIPILINEQSSVFSIDDFVAQRNTFFNLDRENTIKKVLKKLMPDINRNIKAKKNYAKLAQLLLCNNSSPKVLVIGGSILGQGMESLLLYPSIELIESDVSFGPRAMLICDAHNIPFENDSFDGVIAQAVLEHVVDPYRCADEIHRVLKKGGFVYSEIPFIQQVHGGRYDFTRFTHMGIRHLFRKFEEIDSGATCGPGMALAWSYQYFLLSFTNSKFIRILILIFSGLTSFYLKYFDSYLVDKPGGLDAASGYYFVGIKSYKTLSDKELLRHYQGAE